MADVLLSLTLPSDIAQDVEDLLLSQSELVRGFTSSQANGHGAVIPLVAPSELVSGHSPRTQIRMVGTEENMRAVLALIKTNLPDINVFYWLVPVIEMGHI